MTAQLLIEDFSLVFRTRHGTVRALEDISLTVDHGEILGVVGESGSGKSVLAYAVMGLQDAAARVQGGRIVFGGLDMLRASEPALSQVRGRELAMIFQSPRTALNPIRKVGHQIQDILRQHANLPSRSLREHAVAAPGAGAHPRSTAPLPGLSVRAVRRHVPAGDDRHGTGLLAVSADRR